MATGISLNRIRSSSTPTRVQVYVALRNAIVRGQLEPGQRLSENTLAGEMGVSRTPIREGLSLLREDRLVETVPQLGSFVARVDPAAIADAQFIRESLECAAVRLAAQSAGTADIAGLEENLQDQERAVEQGDPDAFYLLDDSFHHTLCDLSGHLSVWTVSERAKTHLNRIRRLSLGMPNYLEEMISEHRRVVDAVAEHDPDRAEMHLRAHLRTVLREVPRMREEHPDYFERPEDA
ncbi:MAG TPA: GntR family transcriptional regulator [Solirubrobacterales bacterium]|jgi:DNA-binding GntR family transcriptional regulator|nr:GntR family transcriptional regulator [Solirubrobacterales bacterium]